MAYTLPAGKALGYDRYTDWATRLDGPREVEGVSSVRRVNVMDWTIRPGVFREVT